jgi:para-nitrobenzyl esterase
MYVSMLMASPLARGLFHRAIGESGAQFPSGERPMLSLREAEQQGIAFAAKLGAMTAAELRAMSTEAILDAHPGLGFWPIVDGHFLKERPFETFAKGQQADVPLLAGWNKDEGFNFDAMNWPSAKQGYEHLLTTLFGENAQDVLSLYPAGQHSKDSARALGGRGLSHTGRLQSPTSFAIALTARPKLLWGGSRKAQKPAHFIPAKFSTCWTTSTPFHG